MYISFVLVEVGGFQTDKVGQFSSTDSKKQTFRNQGLCSCWQRVDSLDEGSRRTHDITFCWLWRIDIVPWPLRRDIIADRAGIRPFAACSIMMRRLVTFSHDTMKLFRIVLASKWENILSCKGSNPCSVNYNILPRRGQWTLANLLSQQNIRKNWSIMTKCKKSAE
jgi:hypothetical protein